MDPKPTAPGEGGREPLLADQPLPPGSNAEEIVDELDRRIRQGGPAEVAEADREADAVEPKAGQKRRKAHQGSNGEQDEDDRAGDTSGPGAETAQERPGRDEAS